jgi:hypothetical protein
MCDFAADVCIDLVEHEQWDCVLRSQCGFDCQHQPRDFAAGCGGAQRF